MARIVIIDEEQCGDCHTFMGESAREMEDFYSDSSNRNTKVKRRKILRRCKKCQPVFEEKIRELKKEGKVEIVPFGKSGRKKEDRLITLRDFIGRDKKRIKKEEEHDDGLLRMRGSHPGRRQRTAGNLQLMP